MMIVGLFLAKNALAVEEIKWTGFNTIKIVEQMAIQKGVGSDTLAMVLLLPLVATLVSILHYFVGLTGYGIFMPTMIAISFVSTGILGGLILFAVILGISLLGNDILRKLKLHFWPARAIVLAFIVSGIIGMMTLPIVDWSRFSVYNILFMILLVEEFVRTQLIKSKKEARSLTIGTLLLAISGAVVMSVGSLQSWVVNNADLTVLLVIVINIMVGNYRGIRLLEIGRFSKGIRKK